jgi:UDP-glucose 4-epimerase
MSELWAVTGATGYLGAALRADLQADSIAVRGLGRSASAKVRADVRDPRALRDLVHGAAVVVHLAACVHRTPRGRAQREECRSVNVDGTGNVVEAVSAAEGRPFLIHVSSAAVYGAGETAAEESSPCAPRGVYGTSKLEAERIVLDAVKSGSVDACILRPAMIFGPGAPGNLRPLARMVRSGWAVEIAGGTQKKSIVPVSHAVAAIRAVAARRAACNGEVFNVAGETLTIHEIITLLASAPPRVVSIPRRLAAAGIAVVRLLSPRIAAMGETYASSVVLSGAKLAAAGFAPRERVREALARLRAGGA